MGSDERPMGSKWDLIEFHRSQLNHFRSQFDIPNLSDKQFEEAKAMCKYHRHELNRYRNS